MNLAELERPELEDLAETLGARRFHGRQIFQWIQARGVCDPAAMTNLPTALRASLAESHVITAPAVDEIHTSVDGTTKFKLRLDDGRAIESVFIPDTPAQTFCVSTQV